MENLRIFDVIGEPKSWGVADWHFSRFPVFGWELHSKDFSYSVAEKIVTPLLSALLGFCQSANKYPPGLLAHLSCQIFSDFSQFYSSCKVKKMKNINFSHGITIPKQPLALLVYVLPYSLTEAVVIIS